MPPLMSGGEIFHLSIQPRNLLLYTPGFSCELACFFCHLFLLYLEFHAYSGYVFLEFLNFFLSRLPILRSDWGSKNNMRGFYNFCKSLRSGRSRLQCTGGLCPSRVCGRVSCRVP